MMDASAAHYKLCKVPRFSVDILRSLRAEVDALLGFQRSLFDEDEPPVVLATTQMAELSILVEALLLEIAAALANGGIADDQDQR
jgi:hypothetical protein